MTASNEELELKDRLSLIETMIAEGRRSTESYAWTFILWGVAYYVAIAWSTWGFGSAIWARAYLAWPITMTAAFLLTWFLAVRKRRGNDSKQPATTAGRAIASIWIAMGISMFILLFSMGVSGRGDQQVYVAVIAAMLGTSNAASAMLLRWKQQFACAAVWWAAAVASCFGTVTQSSIALLVAIFFCQIVFGIYGMVCEARLRKQRGAIHA
ncbi:MAG: hypothetical protein ABR898_01225 [Terracidiphilus sp.]|jgi:hypothetical protein